MSATTDNGLKQSQALPLAPPAQNLIAEPAKNLAESHTVMVSVPASDNAWLFSMVGVATAVIAVLIGVSYYQDYRINSLVSKMRAKECDAEAYGKDESDVENLLGEEGEEEGEEDGEEEYQETDDIKNTSGNFDDTKNQPKNLKKLLGSDLPTTADKVTVPPNANDPPIGKLNEKAAKLDFTTAAGPVPQSKKESHTAKLEAERKKRQKEHEENTPDLPASDYFEGENPADFFFYDRQITAYIKPCHRNTPDYIRGDLYIPPAKDRGMFSVPPSMVRDLCAGALSQISDQKPRMDRTDLLFDHDTPRDKSVYDNEDDWKDFNPPFKYDGVDFDSRSWNQQPDV